MAPDGAEHVGQGRSKIRCLFSGGEGIRTPGTVAGTAVFKTAAFDHSATPPSIQIRFSFYRTQTLADGLCGRPFTSYSHSYPNRLANTRTALRVKVSFVGS